MKFILLLLFLLTMTLIIYTRVIKIKEVKLEHIQTAKFVVISDLHLGLFKKEKFFKRVVDKVNEIEDVDAIFLLGDMFFASRIERVNELIKPIAQFKKPVYFVWGNHDYDKVGDTTLKELIAREFEKYSVEILDNQAVQIQGLRVYGVDDLQDGTPDVLSVADGDIILAHNPDTSFLYTHKVKNTITLSGHTHCGQIRIPVLFRYVLPTRGAWYKKDLYHLQDGNRLYVTCGLGEIYLPFRFMATPEITILNLYD